MSNQITNVARLRHYLRLDPYEQDHKVLRKMLDNLEASKKIAEFINKIEDIEVSVQMNRTLEDTENAKEAVIKALNELKILRSLIKRYKKPKLGGNLEKLQKRPNNRIRKKTTTFDAVVAFSRLCLNFI